MEREALRQAVETLERLARQPHDPASYGRVAEAMERMGRVLSQVAPGEAAPRVEVELAPLYPLLEASPFIRRLRRWPRGYVGDFETVEYLVDRQNRAEPGTLGYHLETFALEMPATEQHRQKLVAQAEVVADAVRAAADTPAILSLGSGGAADLREIAAQLAPAAPQVTLVDSDPDALGFARSHPAMSPLSEGLQTVCGNAVRLVRGLVRDRYDVVVAGGLFDYLPDRALTHVLACCWKRGLKPGGRIFFTNFAAPNPFRGVMDWLVRWPLIERSADDLVRLCDGAGIPAGALELRNDPTGLTWLATVRAPA